MGVALRRILYGYAYTPLAPASRAICYGRLSTYDESVLKLSKVSFWGKRARTRHPLKLPSPTKLARLGCFPPASQAGRLAGPVFYTKSFLWIRLKNLYLVSREQHTPPPTKNINTANCSYFVSSLVCTLLLCYALLLSGQ